MAVHILGISAFYHDSAVALVTDGLVVAAAQEERFTRKKHDAGFPRHALRFCLDHAGLDLDALEAVVFYDKPFLKFERLLETYLAFAPQGFPSFRMAMPLWLKEKLFQKDLLAKELRPFAGQRDPLDLLLFSEHHLSHAASAFYPSPFENALVLTMDGVGEWATTSVALGRGADLQILRELHFPHSLGLFYSALTYYLGFKVNSGEYKVMGLAPYGQPRYVGLMRTHLLDIKPDGSFRLNQEYFNYCTGLTMTNDRFAALFGQPVRGAEAPLTPFHMDVAASLQQVTEGLILTLTRALAAETGETNLCLAGGVALNCVANGRVLRDGRFAGLWVQPAAGDAGGALGAALAAYHLHFAHPRQAPSGLDGMAGGYLGPEYSSSECAARLSAMGARITEVSLDALLEQTVAALVAGKAVGWFQGRMEFGPRALGGRSILGDPRSPTMQRTLNLKVKYRESFRPFAPSVLREEVAEWFDLDGDSPYMLLVADVVPGRRRAMTAAEETLFGIEKLNVPRSEIPAVTHVDYSARIQTVHVETNPLYHALLKRFQAQTGCPVLINTSFNVRGEPIVGTPEDAFRCFMGTEMDLLVVGNCVLRKEAQDPALAQDYKASFDLD
jgi:carbamoyltransferase